MTQQTQDLIDATLPLQFATGLQPQFTAIPPQFTSIPPQFTSIQPQFTSFNPYLQAAQQEAMQAEYMRQQAEYAQLQQLQAQQIAVAPGFFPQQLPSQQQPLVPQTTSLGSNNPFLPHSPLSSNATGIGAPSSPTVLPARPSSDVTFNLSGTYEGREPEPPRSRSELQPQRPYDTNSSSSSSSPNTDNAYLRPFSTGSEPRRRGREREDERLAALFANYTGDGVDTFGNVGPLRCVQFSVFSFVFEVPLASETDSIVLRVLGSGRRSLGGSRRRRRARLGRVRARRSRATIRSCSRFSRLSRHSNRNLSSRHRSKR